MRGMILAAGRGQRMRELTDAVPKPLLKVADRYLIEYAIGAMSKMGIQEIIINICYHREQIKLALGNGERYGVRIFYSEETDALETGGGICQALPLLGEEPFVVLSCDVITDYPLEKLTKNPRGLAHIVMVENPAYHPRGDFCLEGDRVYCDVENSFTFGNIGVYRPELFSNYSAGKFRLGDVLKNAISQNQITGELYQGSWHNIGTPEDLQEIDKVW